MTASLSLLQAGAGWHSRDGGLDLPWPTNTSGKASLGFREPGILLWGWKRTWKEELGSGAGAARLYQPPAAAEGEAAPRKSSLPTACWK